MGESAPLPWDMLGTRGGWREEAATTAHLGATEAMCFCSVSYADIVNCDLKSTLRVLYNLFTKYRNVE